MNFNIPETSQQRIVIIGGGFAGLSLAKNLKNSDFQIVLIDKNNYYQFQPLFYQVATAGLEPSSIIFPFRKLFQKYKNVHFRMASAEAIDIENNILKCDIGNLKFDVLVIANGVDTNWFGNDKIRANAIHEVG